MSSFVQAKLKKDVLHLKISLTLTVLSCALYSAHIPDSVSADFNSQIWSYLCGSVTFIPFKIKLTFGFNLILVQLGSFTKYPLF